MWNQVVENIKTFFNQPVPVIGCTIGALLFLILTIISKTSIGKKALNVLKELYNKLNNDFIALLKAFADHKQKIDEKLVEQKIVLENELKSKQEEIDKLEKLLIEISGNIHNAKVKELVDTYIKEKEENGE